LCHESSSQIYTWGPRIWQEENHFYTKEKNTEKLEFNSIMIRNTQLPPSKGLGPPDDRINELHWTKQVRETVVSAFHDDLHISLQGGADFGQFCFLGPIRVEKINYHGGKLKIGDIVLEIQGQKISGYTQRDAILWLKQVSQNGAPVMIKTVPSTGSLPKDLSTFLLTRFKKGSVDHDLQQIIRDNLYMRTVPCKYNKVNF
jgi:hypothetical protein